MFHYTVKTRHTATFFIGTIRHTINNIVYRQSDTNQLQLSSISGMALGTITVEGVLRESYDNVEWLIPCTVHRY